MRQCLRALASLHASPNPVIHRDIKPENILVEDGERLAEPREPGPWIKLADFGEATQGSQSEGEAGTWLYAAPETFSGQAYDSKVDVWSLGVVILQLLLMGQLPIPTKGGAKRQWCRDIITFVNHKHQFHLHRITSQGNDGSILETTLWGSIAVLMLKLKPEDRMSAQQCLDSPLLTALQGYERLRQEYQRSLAEEASNSARQPQDQDL